MLRSDIRLKASDISLSRSDIFAKAKGAVYLYDLYHNIKKPKNDHLWPIQVKETTYTEIDDISPRINIGQPIASLRVPLTPRITEHYYVHKAQEGGKLGLHSILMKNINS